MQKRMEMDLKLSLSKMNLCDPARNYSLAYDSIIEGCSMPLFDGKLQLSSKYFQYSNKQKKNIIT